MKKPVLRKFTKKKASNVEKIKEAKTQFPKIPRLIPVHLPRISATNTYIFSICFLCGVFLMVILLQEQILRQAYQQREVTTLQREKLKLQVQHWQVMVQKYPDYRDGFFQLALLEYQLGDRDQTTENVQNALRLDPNFIAGGEMIKRLQSKK